MTLVIFLFALWLVLGFWLLRRSQLSPVLFGVCCGALVVAVAVRVFYMDHVTQDYDLFLSAWVQFFRDHGGFAGIRDSVGDYNVPYLYFLALFSYLPVKDLYLIKLLSIFCDLLLAWAAMRLVRKALPGKDDWAAGVFCAVLLLPTVVLNGACWAQCDSAYVLLALLSLYDALDDHPVRSVVWLGVAFSVKLQVIFVIPLWCVLWYTGRIKFKHFLFFPAAFLGTGVPAILLGKPIGDILGVYFKQMGQYNDRLTLNAPSLYGLLPDGAEVDKALMARVGILAAFAFVLALLGVLFVFRKRLTVDHILTAALMLSLAVPMMLPHMHDRYFFLAEIFALLWCAGDFRRLFAPILIQTASLSGYHAYLKGQYLYPVSWGGKFYPYAWGALFMLATLLAVTGLLAWSVWKHPKVPEPVGKSKPKKR